ncbi:hypothetical protein AYO20_02372 [Fonsecaea nubica]|uniref:Peptidase S8/S53 domain-containing protein n=1 Tax=Fonsecaea nubica TaxID=856822 RepID=A0A178DAQ2_9EURO|nr:hypothetical protein AYO20_02372 [Fonsecaea nubica]OAL38313.1 hypothetical protein AYO20_02372 [Fonsecaea nubica]
MNRGDVDTEVDLTRIEKLRRIEKKAIDAIDIPDWETVKKHYSEMDRLVKGWLAPGDPNVLLIQTHLAEALTNQGMIDEAIDIQHDLLDRIEADTEVEKAILNHVLHLQIAVVEMLLLRNRGKDALDILQNALEVSVEGLGRKHETTDSIRENHSRVLEWERRNIQKRVDRLKAKANRRDKTVPVTAATGSPIYSPQTTPEIRLPSSTADTFDNEAVGLGICIAGDTSSNTSFPRPRSSSAQLPEGTSQPVAFRGRPIQSPRTRPEPPAKPLGLQRDQQPNDLSKFASLRGSQTPSLRAGDPSRPVANASPLAPPQQTMRARSADHGGPETSSSRAVIRSDTIDPDFSDAALLACDETESKEQVPPRPRLTSLSGNSTDEWFSVHLKETHSFLEGFRVLNSGAGLRPRIAFLDTGLNTEHPEVQKLKQRTAKERRLRGFWAPPSTDWRADQDEDGHGTTCAMVAHKVAPNADIYIARVFKDRKHALDHAVNVWQVDIISMSFAISKIDKRTKEAMSAKFEEIKDKVLLFAAASNSGRNDGRAYPAKRPEVMAIHAAYGGGGPWKNNPLPSSDDAHNFSTLGMYVETPYTGQATKRVSGTSVACPVAAGIAALVLEFCRQPLVKIKKPERLKHKKGMAAIFSQMYNRFEASKAGKEEDYFYLRPWKLMVVKDTDDDTAAAWHRVASLINEAFGEDYY